MSKDPEVPRSLFERRHGAVPVNSLAPDGEEDVVPMNALAPEGERDVVPMNALAPEGERDVVPMNALAPDGERDVVPMNALAPDGERDVVPVNALAPDGDRGTVHPATAVRNGVAEDATSALPGWEQWESALAAADGGISRDGGESELPAQSSPVPFPTDEFGFLDLPENYRLAAARGVADPAEWPTDAEWRKAAATPVAGNYAVSEAHDAASRDIELRLQAAKLLTRLADRVRDGSLPLQDSGAAPGEAGLLSIVLASLARREEGSASARHEQPSNAPGAEDR